MPRHVGVRVYLTAQDDGFLLMPGGLTRVTASEDSMVVSLQRGGGSKDTWVLSDTPVSDFTMLRPAGQTIQLSRAGNDLPSRAADNLFWLGRYVQRAEDMVRLLRGIVVRLTEKSGLADVPELPTLLRAVTHLTQTLPGFVGAGAEEPPGLYPGRGIVLADLSARAIGSLSYNYRCIQRAAASVRDRISMDMWRILGSLPPDDPFDPANPPTLSDAAPICSTKRVFDPRRLRRHRHGEHDARPRLALPGHGPQDRGGDAHDRPVASDPQRGVVRTAWESTLLEAACWKSARQFDDPIAGGT